jgi:hypothetical protein
LFAFQQSKNIAQVIDATSNTIVFAESTVGVPAETARQKLIGLVNVTLPAGALQANAFTNPPEPRGRARTEPRPPWDL